MIASRLARHRSGWHHWHPTRHPVRGCDRVGALFCAGSLAIASAFLIAGFAGARRLRVRQVELAIPGLPEPFEGLRVVQLSDLHVGPHSSRRFLARIAEETLRLSPDVIAVTGDLVDDRAEDVAAHAASLGGLSAPLGV